MKTEPTPAERAWARAATRDDTLRELRALVAAYLEGSDDAPRAAELLDALDKPVAAAHAAQTSSMPDDQARAMFGCTETAINEALAGKEPRDIAMYAMGTLSNAQEYIPRSGAIADRHANTIRQLMNIAKHAINKAVPR